MVRFKGAILAGGSARRFGGAPKGCLPAAEGETIVARLLAAFAEAGIEPVEIVANDPGPYVRFGRAILADLRPGLGPLAGIEAALRHADNPCEALVVVACDLPGLTAAELRLLVAAYRESGGPVVVAEGPDGSWQPLCAVVSGETLSAIGGALDRGQRGVERLWRDLGARSVRCEEAGAFFNVNTPGDLAAWQAGRAR